MPANQGNPAAARAARAERRAELRNGHSEMVVIEPSEMTGAIRRRLEPTNRNLRILNPTGKDAVDYEEELRRKPRLRYAGMRAHQEMAAQALAVGATQKMAANYAGVAQRQIKKYMADPDFRSRIEELRAVLASKIKGKIMRELNRRVTGPKIHEMETLEMLRIFDRVTIGGKGNAINVQGDVNVGDTHYETILADLFANPGTDGIDFPQYGDTSPALPRGGTPVDG